MSLGICKKYSCITVKREDFAPGVIARCAFDRVGGAEKRRDADLVAKPPRVESNFTRPQFLAAVRKSKQHIRAGDIFQMVISQRFSARTEANAFEICDTGNNRMYLRRAVM